jgi:hypothetical protein
VGLQRVAIGAMKPGDHEDLVTDLDPTQGARERWVDVDPRVRRAL